jgi:hypothetical protein
MKVWCRLVDQPPLSGAGRPGAMFNHAEHDPRRAVDGVVGRASVVTVVVKFVVSVAQQAVTRIGSMDVRLASVGQHGAQARPGPLHCRSVGRGGDVGVERGGGVRHFAATASAGLVPPVATHMRRNRERGTTRTVQISFSPTRPRGNSLAV